MRNVPVNESALETLRAVFVDNLTVSSVKRSVDLTFSVATCGDDLDPDLEIPYRRAAMSRRNMNKDNLRSKLLQKGWTCMCSKRLQEHLSVMRNYGARS